MVALFDDSISEDIRNSLAKQIGSLPSDANLPIKKPALPTISKFSTLSNFVGQRSVTLFNLLGISPSFLDDPNWRELPEYEAVKGALKNLSPLNDFSERALHLATTVNEKMTEAEDSYQELVLFVEQHRKKYGLKTKSDLKKLL